MLPALWAQSFALTQVLCEGLRAWQAGPLWSMPQSSAPEDP